MYHVYILSVHVPIYDDIDIYLASISGFSLLFYRLEILTAKLSNLKREVEELYPLKAVNITGGRCIDLSSELQDCELFLKLFNY